MILGKCKGGIVNVKSRSWIADFYTLFQLIFLLIIFP